MRGLDQRGPSFSPFIYRMNLAFSPSTPPPPPSAGRPVATTAAIVVEGVIAFPLDGFTVPSRCTTCIRSSQCILFQFWVLLNFCHLASLAYKFHRLTPCWNLIFSRYSPPKKWNVSEVDQEDWDIRSVGWQQGQSLRSPIDLVVKRALRRQKRHRQRGH